MPMDGLVIAALVPELQQELAGARIQKIYQPVEHQFLLGLYRGKRRWLVLSLEPTHPFLCLLEEVSSDNPPSPPAFCMLLRKY
ncbi:MAG: NFACT family protein, partial [Bacillota bacterium]|nr:NFACT family protein [Bacillota bacterium]